jgi:hypothetical protein
MVIQTFLFHYLSLNAFPPGMTIKKLPVAADLQSADAGQSDRLEIGRHVVADLYRAIPAGPTD